MKKMKKVVLFSTLAFSIAAIYFYFAITGISDRLGIPRTQAGPLYENEVTFDMKKNRAYTSEDGIVIIGSSSEAGSAKTRVLSAAVSSPDTVDYGPEKVWEHEDAAAYNNFTIPKQAELKDGSLGILSIPVLNISANVYETDDPIEAMSHGIAHFKSTSAWQGNVALSAHNVNLNLTDGYFKKLHTLKKGDEVTYRTQLGERHYVVDTVSEIADTDWSYLGRTEDNRITMITCITGKPSLRLCVQAVEKST